MRFYKIDVTDIESLFFVLIKAQELEVFIEHKSSIT